MARPRADDEPPPPGASASDADAEFHIRRLRETASKLVFYTAFTVRQRTQLTAVSMRSLSMFMMFFMMMTVTATKQQQAR